MHPQTATIGREIDRVEGCDKVTGRAQYAADFAFANIAYASLVQSAIAHGHVDAASLRRSTAKAEGAPGVLRVMTPLNFPHLRVLPRDLTGRFQGGKSASLLLGLTHLRRG